MTNESGIRKRFMQFFGSGSDSAAAEADEVELEQTMKEQMELPG